MTKRHGRTFDTHGPSGQEWRVGLLFGAVLVVGGLLLELLGVT